ncbi:MAG: putative quinol monooxygenase [Pseudomonadota bacterium]
MIIVTGTFELPGDGVDKAKDAMASMVAETLKEDGCIEYRFWQSISSPTTFRVYEEWESDAHLEAHFATPHMATFRAALGEINLISRQVKKMVAGAVTDL